MNKEEFYKECDRLFKQSHPPPMGLPYRRRWGPRTPGSGRFEGFGLVRWFSPTVVHIAIRYPISIQTCVTAMQALEQITAMLISN